MQIAKSDFSSDCTKISQAGWSVWQPLCHFVTPPPAGGDYACQEISMQYDGKYASKMRAKPLGVIYSVIP